MGEIELSPKKLRLLDRIVSEGELAREQLTPAEGMALLSLLRGDLVRLNYERPKPTVVATGRGRQLIENTNTDSATVVKSRL